MTTQAFGSAIPLVVDTSAWHRQREAAVVGQWSAAIENDQLASCPAAALEILYSAQNEWEFDLVERTLSSLPQAPVTATVCQAALGAAREFGSAHRIPAADYLIAAAAAERGYGVLHADRHFDLLATVLPFESVRLPE